MLPISEGQSGNVVSCEDGRGDLQARKGQGTGFSPSISGGCTHRLISEFYLKEICFGLLTSGAIKR